MTHRDMLVNICCAVDGESYDPSAFDRWKENFNKRKDKTMKNVLFLAPGYQYAKTVVFNLSKELDRKRIPFNASVVSHDMYIRTDKVSVEIYYEDPITWTGELIARRDAVFGKEELLEKAAKTFFRVMVRPKTSLSKYISDEHKDGHPDDTEIPTAYIPEITKVHFNDPMTIVLWADGTKTVVKCQDGDVYSKETGLAVAIAKKALGNKGNFNEVFKKWIPEYGEEFTTTATDNGPVAININNTQHDAQDLVNLITEKVRDALKKPLRGIM